MQVPNRFYNGADYRYGFQGQEKDNEIKGEGNSLNYTFRMYDPRIGKFLSKDPLSINFPWYSPYQMAGNNPILAFDLEGLEMQISNTVKTMKVGQGISQLNFETDINIHYKILNLTNHKLSGTQQITNLASSRASMIYSDLSGTDNFSISFDDKGNLLKKPINYKINAKIKRFEASFTFVNSVKDINDNDYAILFVDKRLSKPDLAYVNGLGGNVMIVDIGNPEFGITSKKNGINFNLIQSIAQKIARVITHEIGHNLALDDKYDLNTGKPNPGYEKNIMGDSDEKGLTSQQIGEIINNIFTKDRINNFHKKKEGKAQTDGTKSQLKAVMNKEKL